VDFIAADAQIGNGGGFNIVVVCNDIIAASCRSFCHFAPVLRGVVFIGQSRDRLIQKAKNSAPVTPGVHQCLRKAAWGPEWEGLMRRYYSFRSNTRAHKADHADC